MRWKGDDDAVDLVLILAPEGSWIILDDHDKVLRHLFGPCSGRISCRALAQVESAPYGGPQP